MKSVSLLLLVCLCELDATELNDEVLRKIVRDFQQEAKAKSHSQFSFLIALNPQQCSSYQPNLYLRNSEKTLLPSITKSPNEFHEPLNYLAVYPDVGERCSEFKILFQDRDGKLTPEWFADKIEVLSAGGCMIFYTTNTPCTAKCFSGKHQKDISAPLLSRPFQNWRSEGQNVIHKYFVYTQVYNCDKNNTNAIIHHFKCLDESAFDLNGSFLFRKCEENKPCEMCNRQNCYCVN